MSIARDLSRATCPVLRGYLPPQRSGPGQTLPYQQLLRDGDSFVGILGQAHVGQVLRHGLVRVPGMADVRAARGQGTSRLCPLIPRRCASPSPPTRAAAPGRPAPTHARPPCPRRSPGDAGRGAAAGAAVEPLAVEVVGVFVPPVLPLGLRHGGHTRAPHGAAALASGHHGKCSSETAAPRDKCTRRTATPGIHRFRGGGYGIRKGPLLSPWPWRPGRPRR